MDGIVAGISQISFHQNLNKVSKVNSPPRFADEPSVIMSVSESNFPNSEVPESVYELVDNSNLSEAKSNGDNDWEEIKEHLENRRNRKGYTLAERRQLPSRASKESSLGIKRRTIMKPTKRIRSHEDFQNLKHSDIKKIYLNKRLTNFKPSSLETIFEETAVYHNEQDCSQLMGGRKIKRSLSFSNGFKYSKTLVNKRRAKIKKTFGKKFALKKVSLEEFITKLNSNMEKNEDIPNNDYQINSDRSEIVILNNSVNSDEEMAANGEVTTKTFKEFKNNASL